MEEEMEESVYEGEEEEEEEELEAIANLFCPLSRRHCLAPLWGYSSESISSFCTRLETHLFRVHLDCILSVSLSFSLFVPLCLSVCIALSISLSPSLSLTSPFNMKVTAAVISLLNQSFIPIAINSLNKR